jgi:hypothetical protein
MDEGMVIVGWVVSAIGTTRVETNRMFVVTEHRNS